MVTNVLLIDDEHPYGVTRTIIFSGGIIADVRDDSGPSADTIIDGQGKTMIPGLIDAHFHAYASEFDGFGIDSSPTSYVALQGARKLREALHRGFTTVRDVAGGDLGVQRALARGVIDGPDYFFTGPALSQTGGHGDSRHPGVEACAHHQHMGEVVDGVDNVRRVVRERLRGGAHAIKVMASGGVSSQADPLRAPQYSIKELEAAVEEAQQHGTYVTVHAYTAEAVQRAIHAGVQCVEHGNLIDDLTIELMAEKGTALVPTLSAYEAMERRGHQVGMSQESRTKNSVVLEHGRRAARAAYDAGVPVGFGTDLMGDLDDEQLTGLCIQSQVLGFHAALTSATRVNAAILGLPDRGRLAPGMRADAVLIQGDLRRNPELLWDSQATRKVFLAGRQIGSEPEYVRLHM